MRYLKTRVADQTQDRCQDDDHSVDDDNEDNEDNENNETDPVEEASDADWKVSQDMSVIPQWIVDGGNSTHISEGRGKTQDRGFTWRPGQERCTEGVWFWSEPFVFNKNRRKIGVLLMDTQGAWDSGMNRDQSATIFGLTALLSSKLIYNIQNHIEDDKLENMDYFTTFAQAACSAGHSALFGDLEFLIRDWQHYDDGMTHEQCKEVMHEHLMSHLEEDKVSYDAKERVGRLKQTFQNIRCSGLVHPGLKVVRKNFDGALADIDKDFLHLLDCFVKRLFGGSFPEPSAPLGFELTADAFKTVVKNFANAFRERRGMSVGIRDAFVRLQATQTREKLVKVFKKTLKASFPDSVVLDPATLERSLQDLREDYCGRFAREIRPFRMAPEECKLYEDEFDQVITEIFERRNRANEEIVETATMKMVAAPVISVSVYFLFLHHWMLVAVLVGGGVCHMKKWSSKRNVSMCHPAVAEGIYVDTKNFALQRWQDLQAMQVAIRRLRSEEAIRILKVMGRKGKEMAGNICSRKPATPSEVVPVLEEVHDDGPQETFHAIDRARPAM
uniref:Guanylate-binding protein N-terminal domain-containing protein n=1 Tax=Noctiluca scintillans TaxID=2966 RepID=A0A7S0ZQS4_NOCSC